MSDASRVAGAGKVRLGDVAKIDGRIPYPKTNDVWLLNLDKVEQQSGRVIDKLIVPLSSIGGSTVAFDKSCVLYSKLRPNLNKVVLPDQDGVATSELLPLKCDSSLDRRYLCAYLRSPNFVSYAVGRTIGAKMPRLSSKDLLVAQFSLPPLPAQRRIADELDQLCALKKNAEDRLAILDQIVKSRFVEMFGDPVANPLGWTERKISEFADVKIGPFGSVLHKEDYVSGGHPLVNPSHMKDGQIFVDDDLTLTDEKYNELAVYHLQIGDVVVARRGEIGRCALVETEGLFCGTGSMFVRVNGDCLPDYLQRVISFPTYAAKLELCAVGVTMKNINAGMIGESLVPMPPLSLQREFAAFVAEVDKSKVALRETVATLDQLYRAKLQEYFG